MKLKRFLKQNNRGSGIVTVLVAIVFLSSFGSMLLMLSYTGSEMRISDRKGKENLYDASAVMEQISAGVQSMCSDAIVNAYADTFTLYNDYGVNVVKEFQVKYRENLFNWAGAYMYDGEIKEPGSAGYVRGLGQLFRYSGTHYLYSLDVLEAMIVDKIGGNVSVSSESIGDSMLRLGYVDNFNTDIVDGEKPVPIVLRDVSVTFSTPERTTKVVSDITIDYPNVGFGNSSHNNEGVNQHACVIKGNLIQKAGQGDSTIYGDSYFGGVELSGSGSTMTFKAPEEDATFIVKDKILINGADSAAQKRFTLSNDTNNTLWVNEIEIKEGGVDLNGDMYVANDLLFNSGSSGIETSAKLSGSYNGFGNSADDSSASSSILVNSKSAKLDMTGLNNLSLSGKAFIGDSNRLHTGESLSTREMQRAYLLPPEMVYYVYHGTMSELLTNPEKMETAKFQAIQNPSEEYATDGFYIHESSAFWGNKNAASYGITSIAVDSEDFPGSGNQQKMVYAFASFDTPEHANEFIKDYFTFNPQKVAEYVQKYVDISGGPASASTAGIYPYIDAEGNLVKGEAVPNADYFESGSAVYSQTFENLCTTLGMASSEDEDCENPLEFILSEEIEDLSGEYPYIAYYNEDGVIVAIAANGDVTLTKAVVDGREQEVIKVKNAAGQEHIIQNANPDNVCLILTTGNMLVDGIHFDGLIIAEGDLEMKHSAVLNEDPTRVTAAYSAKSGDGSNITDFIETEDEGNSRDSSLWSVDTLVGYNNWKRSTDED